MNEEIGEKTQKIVEYEHKIKPEFIAIIAFLIGMSGTIFVTWLLGVPLADMMESIQGTFLYHFIPFLVSTIFFIVLIYKTYVKDISGLMFLASAVMLHGAAELLYVISPPEGSIFQRGDNILASIADVFFPIAVILIYLHIELIEKVRPNLVHAIGIVGTSLPMIIGQIALIIIEPIPGLENIKEQITNLILIYLGVFAVIILWISLFGIRIMFGNLKHADSPQIARASLFVFIGFSSLLTNFILLGASYSYTFLEEALLFGGNSIIIHNTWLITLALIFMLAAYVMVPEFAYALNFDVYQLLVLHAEMGITLYSFTNEIRDTSGKIKHDALKSPAILAIRDLVREIASAKGYILLLELSDKMIIMKTHEEIVSVLIAEQNSYFMNKGLEGFTQQFYEQFKENIVNFDGNVGIFAPAKDIVKRNMPFMRSESLQLDF